MTAIFIPRYTDRAGGDEFFACRAWAERNGFTKAKVYCAKRADDFSCRVRKIGAEAFCIFSEPFKDDDFLGLCSMAQNMRVPRLVNLVKQVFSILSSTGADTKSVYIFLHNGHDIPPGYEDWANNKLCNTQGLEEWRLSLLSSSRAGVFDLRQIDTNSEFKEALAEEDSFISLVTSLGNRLQGKSV